MSPPTIPSWVKYEIPAEYAAFSVPPLALMLMFEIGASLKTSSCQSVPLLG